MLVGLQRTEVRKRLGWRGFTPSHSRRPPLLVELQRMAGSPGGGFSGPGRVLSESLDGLGPLPPPPQTHPPVPLASELGFAQPRPDPAAGSTRLVNGADARGRFACRLRGTCLNHKGRLPPARLRMGAKLGPFAGAQRRSPPGCIELAGERCRHPKTWGGGRRPSWREAGMGRGRDEASVSPKMRKEGRWGNWVGTGDQV